MQRTTAVFWVCTGGRKPIRLCSCGVWQPFFCAPFWQREHRQTLGLAPCRTPGALFPPGFLQAVCFSLSGMPLQHFQKWGKLLPALYLFFEELLALSLQASKSGGNLGHIGLQFLWIGITSGHLDFNLGQFGLNSLSLGIKSGYFSTSAVQTFVQFYEPAESFQKSSQHVSSFLRRLRQSPASVRSVFWSSGTPDVVLGEPCPQSLVLTTIC